MQSVVAMKSFLSMSVMAASVLLSTISCRTANDSNLKHIIFDDEGSTLTLVWVYGDRIFKGYCKSVEGSCLPLPKNFGHGYFSNYPDFRERVETNFQKEFTLAENRLKTAVSDVKSNKLSDKQKIIDEKTKRYRDLTAEISDLTYGIRTLRQSLPSLESKSGDLRDLITNISSYLESHSEDNSALGNLLQQYRSELDSVDREKKAIIDSIDVKVSQLKSTEANQKAMKAEVEQGKMEYKKQFDSIEVEIEELNAFKVFKRIKSKKPIIEGLLGKIEANVPFNEKTMDYNSGEKDLWASWKYHINGPRSDGRSVKFTDWYSQ